MTTRNFSFSRLDPRQWRLRGKLTLAFLLLTLVPLVLVRAINNQITRNALLEQGTLSLTYASTQTADKIDRYLVNAREDIIMARLLPEVLAYVGNPNDATLRANALAILRALASKSDYESVALIASDGKIMLSSVEAEIGMDVRAFRPVQDALQGRITISDPVLNPFDNSPSVGVAAPIFLAGSGTPAAVIRSRLTLYGIWTLIESDREAAGRGSFGVLLDEYNIRLATSLSAGDRERVIQNLLYRAIAPLPADTVTRLLTERRFGAAKEIPILALPDLADAIAREKPVFETTADNSPVRHQAALTTLKIKPWRYVLMAPVATFTSAADTVGAISLALGLAAMLFAILAAVYTARILTRPIVQLTNVADRISLGELDAQVEVTSKDEIGDLAEAIGRMQASLQAAIERLRARRAS